jgi:hypothetical protein
VSLKGQKGREGPTARGLEGLNGQGAIV